VRVAPLLVLLLVCLTVAGPASAHDAASDHTDSRSELRGTDIVGTVETVDAAAGTEGEGLPVDWCGTERDTDNTADAAFPQAEEQFKLVYAYASDRTNRFDAWKNALQANVSLIGRFMGAQSGGRKTPRFDMGTDCGPEYADIQVVALPGTRASYAMNLTALATAVAAEVPAVEGQRNVVVLADQMSSAPAHNWYGVGQYRDDERPGSINVNNLGGYFSALWVPDAEPLPAGSGTGWWAEGFLHEMTHNLGAVGSHAPHASTEGHCYDEWDLMCYDDGGLPQPLTYGCPDIPGVMRQVYDCGGDDYFNVAPTSGYLVSNFNVYDNRFLASCTEAAPACGGTIVPDSNPQPPVATTQPAVSGDARVGAVLSASPGGWANAPTGYAYQWEQSDGLGWTAVPGAADSTYAVTPADLGRRLRVRVIATNADGSSAAYSGATAVVEGAAPAIAPAVAAEPATTATAKPAAAPSRGRATLKIARGRGAGKRLGTIDFQVTGGRLLAMPARVKLARGSYQLRLCTTAGGSRCAKRTLKVARSSVARLPRLSLSVPAGTTGRVTYTVRATRGVFSALTAKRPSAGLLLGP
jgi:hypothetical protein